MYYLQSRYYDPEVCRFINADIYASTGQGFIGYNMFAYCNNNPVICRDDHGYAAGTAAVAGATALSIAEAVLSICISSLLIYIGTEVIPAAVKTVSNYIETQTEKKATEEGTTYARQQSEDRIYTVYVLCAKNDAAKRVVYVGRVKTANYSARMAYHQSKGRMPLERIDSLTYAECRGLEQSLMLMFNTIRRGNPLFNQIQGIGVRNPNGPWYMTAAFDYLSNQLENELLNLNIYP